MKAIVTIDLSNAAFDDCMASELSAMLRRLADHIDCGGFNTSIFDTSGNRVGTYGITQ